MSPPRPPVANFDSASSIVRALGLFHKGLGTDLGGPVAPAVGPGLRALASGVNRLPVPVREQVYRLASGAEALPQDRVAALDGEALSRWVVNQYPARTYPAVVIGSSNGALVHLAAAMGAAFLPQTLLVPVRRAFADPDDPAEDLRRTRATAAAMLARNPDLVLHQMHDANQDRLTIRHLSYFRVKRLRLGETYGRFLRERLAPSGPIILSECTFTWPGTRVADRHVFQHGAPGGATPEEYEHGSARVEDYLRRYDVPRTRWSYPATDGHFPESEWGFAPELRDDVARFARDFDHPMRRLVHPHPERVSPAVADLYAEWYARREIPTRRLLVESFMLLDPHWALRTASVPFWTLFNVQDSVDAVRRFLDARDAFDEIHAVLFSHGVESAGVAPIEAWRSVVTRARREGGFVAVDEDAYPRDFAVFARWPRDLARRVRARHPMPQPLKLDEVDAFFDAARGRYELAWTRGDQAPTFSASPEGAATWTRSTPVS